MTTHIARIIVTNYKKEVINDATLEVTIKNLFDKAILRNSLLRVYKTHKDYNVSITFTKIKR